MDNITSLLHERELLYSRLEKMFYGSIEVRELRGKQYLYTHHRLDGVQKTQYVGEFSNLLVNVIYENNLLVKEYKKRLKEINKQLDEIAYESIELSETVNINIGLARRNLVDSIYKQAMLEGVVTTYSNTETIVNGGKVSNMTTSDITKVVNLKRAWEFILSDGVITYPTNYAILCQINQIIDDGFSTMAGKLRSVPVSIGKSTYLPPMPMECSVKESLYDILHSGTEEIDISIELLLYTMKAQLFLDGNKRTAVIFANHYLVSHGGGILVIPSELVNEYKKHLVNYYEDKDLESIKMFLKEKCWIRMK